MSATGHRLAGDTVIQLLPKPEKGSPAPLPDRSDPGAFLGAADFETFRTFLREATGISLAEQKQYLVKARLANLARAEGYDSLGQLIADLAKRRASSDLRTRVVEAMTTHETFWFRDPAHYEELGKILLPRWIAAGAGSVRLWSAGCSTGEEPYSISMCAEEYLRANESVRRPALEIIGTDVSRAVLAKAGPASYNEFTLGRGLNRVLKQRYFAPVGDRWRLVPEIAGRVRFRALNLLDSLDRMGQFDAIFCRNVLFYFCPDIRRDILDRLARCLKPDGRLFLGSSETLPAGDGPLEAIRGIHCIHYALRGRAVR